MSTIFYFKQPDHRQPLIARDFGWGMRPEDFLAIVTVPFSIHGQNKGSKSVQPATTDLGSAIKKEKDNFQVNLDVQHFAPEEISVKTVEGFLAIEAAHEEKQDDHGFISRSFTRRYALPEGIDPDNMTSKLSSDGVLTISASMKINQAANERNVPVVRTGPVRKKLNWEDYRTRLGITELS